MPDHRGRSGGVEDLLPEDRLTRARDVWADREELAKLPWGAWMLRQAARVLELPEEALDEVLRPWVGLLPCQASCRPQCVKNSLSTFPSVFVCSDAAAEILVGDAAEQIFTQGAALFISSASNDSGYGVLTLHEGPVLECQVAVIEAVGHKRLALECVGRGQD